MLVKNTDGLLVSGTETRHTIEHVNFNKAPNIAREAVLQFRNTSEQKTDEEQLMEFDFDAYSLGIFNTVMSASIMNAGSEFVIWVRKDALSAKGAWQIKVPQKSADRTSHSLRNDQIIWLKQDRDRTSYVQRNLGHHLQKPLVQGRFRASNEMQRVLERVEHIPRAHHHPSALDPSGIKQVSVTGQQVDQCVRDTKYLELLQKAPPTALDPG
ncbi:glycosylhydrolase family 3-6 [Colletotrichum acutatum]